MREIKFRAFDKKTKKMRAVNSIVFNYENEAFNFNSDRLPKIVQVWGHDLIEDKPIILIREIKDVELLEFTGLKDKNGKEIYEGDIANITYSCMRFSRCMDITERGIMQWYSGGAQFSFLVENSILNEEMQNLKVEVIGNIYENPDLLNSHAGRKEGK